MKFSSFFITRPIFAIVLSALIVVAGLLALIKLPVSEYPSVVPPTVVVRAAFPGANPKVIAETVAAPLEQQMNGVEGMLYMFSQSTSDGLLTLTITFALGTDLDKAQVQVQNRVAQALPRLPQEVQRIGVVTEKASPDLMMVVHIVSPDQRYDMLYLSNLAHLQVRDELSRIDGVGSVYSMFALRDAPDTIARVLLSHNPDFAEDPALARHRIDLMISGHTHGGQVRLPFLGSPLIPSRFGQKYAYGHIRGPHCPVLVSAGVGMSLIPVRFGIDPEIVEITLRRA